MKAIRNILTGAFMVCALSLASAAEPDSQDHDVHHPAEAASAPKAKAPAPRASTAKPKAAKVSAATRQNMAMMDMQMKNMGEMHQKMMGAKTPAERGALMGENMKMMQDSMSMMNMMGASGAGAAGKGNMPADQGMSGSMEDRVQMMEKRMDMMQMMMQMMLDAQPAPAAQ